MNKFSDGVGVAKINLANAKDGIGLGKDGWDLKSTEII